MQFSSILLTLLVAAPIVSGARPRTSYDSIEDSRDHGSDNNAADPNELLASEAWITEKMNSHFHHGSRIEGTPLQLGSQHDQMWDWWESGNKSLPNSSHMSRLKDWWESGSTPASQRSSYYEKMWDWWESGNKSLPNSTNLSRFREWWGSGSTTDDSSNGRMREIIDHWMSANKSSWNTTNGSYYDKLREWWYSTTTTTTLPGYILRDVMVGFLDAFGYSHIKSCSAPGFRGARGLAHALEHLSEKARYSAMKDILHALKDIPSAFRYCGVMTDDVTRLEELLADITNPKFFTEQNMMMLFMNAAEAHHQFGNAGVAWMNNHYKKAGKHLGKAVLLILAEPSFPGVAGHNISSDTTMGCSSEHAIVELLRLKNPALYYRLRAETSMELVPLIANTEIAAGLAEGFSISVDNIACFHSASTTGRAVYHLGKGFVTGNAFGAVLALVRGVESLIPLYEDCKADKNKVHSLLHSLSVLRHPVSFMYNAGHNLQINAIDVSLEIATASLAYKQGDYHRVGLEIGKMLANLIVSENTLESSTIRKREPEEKTQSDNATLNDTLLLGLI